MVKHSFFTNSNRLFNTLLLLLLLLSSCIAMAENYPSPQHSVWMIKDFKFHTGEIFSELKIGYTTVGDPTGIPVLILHGTAGTGRGMLNAAFAGTLALANKKDLGFPTLPGLRPTIPEADFIMSVLDYDWGPCSMQWMRLAFQATRHLPSNKCSRCMHDGSIKMAMN